MGKLLIGWLANALSLLIVAHLVPGFEIRGFGSALIAALVIGLINSTLGIILKIITFPLTLVTLGIFWFVINGLMLELASLIVPGFFVQGFWAAFFGAIVLSGINLVLKVLIWSAT